MEKKIEDYLHLYLGCPMMCIKIDEDMDEFGVNIGEIGKLTFINDGNMSVNAGEESENWNMGIEFKKSHFADWYDSMCFKPILRPLSNMTDEEEIEVCNICNLMTATNIKEALIKGGYYVVHVRYGFELTKYLLRQGFDIFGLIEAGLAIDKNNLHPYHP